MNSINCGTCKIKFNHNALRLACGKCDLAYHKKCLKVSDEDWKKYINGDHLFNCDKCRTKRRSSVIGDTSMMNKNTSLVGDKNSDASGIKSDLISLKNDLKSFHNTTKDVEQSLTNLHDTVTALESKIDKIMDRVKDIDVVMAENTRLRHRLDQLEKRVGTLETKKTVTVSQKKTEKPSPSFVATVSGISAEGSELDGKVNELFSSLELNYVESVEKCERSVSKDGSKSVLFISLKSRDHLVKLIKAAKQKRPQNIFVNEKLSPGCNKLLREAKVLRQNGFKHVWSSNGQVLVRKEDNGSVSVIRNVRDIEALKSTSN